MATKGMTIEEELELFLENLNREIPSIKKRFKWAREQERRIDADNSYLWKNTFYYNLMARNCYCCGFYLSAIQLITSSIEMSFKQVFREKFPDLISKQKQYTRLSEYIKLASSKKIISKELKDKLNKFREIIRNPTTHPVPNMSLVFGFEEISNGHWRLRNQQEMIEPEEAAKRGLLLALQLSKEYDEWKLNQLGAESTQSK